MVKIGITGQNGFIGSNLFNKISLLKDKFELIPFKKEFFSEVSILNKWVGDCDVVVHLAGLNRSANQNEILETNLKLANDLIAALKLKKNQTHLIFASSTQEEEDNAYGNSKRKARELFTDWSKETDSVFSGLIISNVFGPFGKPKYNSVIATFSDLLCSGGRPEILVDKKLNLIYVDDLCNEIIDCIINKTNEPKHVVKATDVFMVTEILAKLMNFQSLYCDKGIIPSLDDKFSINLFNTFRSYINPEGFFPYKLKRNEDNRGVFIELVKLNSGGQISFSTTKPDIVRGNHFHTRKVERFAVIKGKAVIEFRKFNTDKVFTFHLDGDEPSFVDMPIWYTHNIKNVGSEELYTVFWINEFYDEANPDTYFENV
jgi:UDP-2-acetamido-2,6-beta-L-arabino-hexul-4-ose reductase